ncbi:MAG: hypothetical protein AAB267_03080 [Candidatus Desantisbacteria bacterium]
MEMLFPLIILVAGILFGKKGEKGGRKKGDSNLFLVKDSNGAIGREIKTLKVCLGTPVADKQKFNSPWRL